MSTQLIHGLAVEIDGDGDALLCIHGLRRLRRTPGRRFLPAFVPGFKVIRPDLPGSARSPLLREPLSIEGYALRLEALLSTLGVETVHVVAHSLGTIVDPAPRGSQSGQDQVVGAFWSAGRAA